jgi:hypothetical protein
MEIPYKKYSQTLFQEEKNNNLENLLFTIKNTAKDIEEIKKKISKIDIEISEKEKEKDIIKNNLKKKISEYEHHINGLCFNTLKKKENKIKYCNKCKKNNHTYYECYNNPKNIKK